MPVEEPSLQFNILKITHKQPKRKSKPKTSPNANPIAGWRDPITNAFIHEYAAIAEKERSLDREYFRQQIARRTDREENPAFRIIRDNLQQELSNLAEEYWPILYALAFSKVHNMFDAQEIVQESFCKIYDSLQKAPGETLCNWHLKPLLFMVVSRKASTHNQRKATLEKKLQSLDQRTHHWVYGSSPSNYDHPENALELSAEREALQKLLDKLHPSYKQLIILLIIQEKSYKEVASLLGCSKESLWTRMSRATDRFTQIVKSAGVTEEELRRWFSAYYVVDDTGPDYFTRNYARPRHYYKEYETEDDMRVQTDLSETRAALERRRLRQKTPQNRTATSEPAKEDGSQRRRAV